MPRWVFTDSSGLIAKFLAVDADHDAADEEMRRLAREGHLFLTTNYIFDEVVTRVRRLAGFRESKRVGEAIRSSKLIRTAYIDLALEAYAWRLYLKYRDQEISFTDATSFAVMETHGLEDAFTFDRDFARVGFTVLPGPTS